MNEFFSPYRERFVRAALSDPEGVLMGVLDQGIQWSSHADDAAILAPLFEKPGLKALVRLAPAEPYRTIISHLSRPGRVIYPNDCETRLFLADLPVIERLSTGLLVQALTHRKCVVTEGAIIVAASAKSLKEAFVSASCACFACFVKFFGDMLKKERNAGMTTGERELLESLCKSVRPPSGLNAPLARGPFAEEADALAAIAEAGEKVVSLGLVDSFFGNISYLMGNLVYISRTGAFLDELDGLVASCPLEDPPEKHPEASSELPAHIGIYLRKTGCRAILHGHPKFSVILSMACDVEDCPSPEGCHRSCPFKRYACWDIPIVSGEVGGGAHGLCHSVPEAICGTPGAIVYGHGVFTCDDADFNGALERLVTIEQRCFREYCNQLGLSIS